MLKFLLLTADSCKLRFKLIKQEPKQPLLLYILNKRAHYQDWWSEDNEFLISEIIKGIRDKNLKSILSMEEFSSVQALQERALVIRQKLASSVSRNCFLCWQPPHLRDKRPQNINLCSCRTRSGKQYIHICKTCHTPGHINHKIVKKQFQGVTLSSRKSRFKLSKNSISKLLTQPILQIKD